MRGLIFAAFVAAGLVGVAGAAQAQGYYYRTWNWEYHYWYWQCQGVCENNNPPPTYNPAPEYYEDDNGGDGGLDDTELGYPPDAGVYEQPQTYGRGWHFGTFGPNVVPDYNYRIVPGGIPHGGNHQSYPGYGRPPGYGRFPGFGRPPGHGMYGGHPVIVGRPSGWPY